MTLLTCAAVRRRLHPFYDRELPVRELIAIEFAPRPIEIVARPQRRIARGAQVVQLVRIEGLVAFRAFEVRKVGHGVSSRGRL